MNINKCFILLLLMLISVSISSQRQVGFALVDLRKSVDSEAIVRKGNTYSASGIPCNGFQIDYYDKEKSKERITGTFKKGLPVDTIKEYYENGNLKLMYYPYKKKYRYGGKRYNFSLIKEYDEQGNLIRFIDDKEGVEKRFDSEGKELSLMLYNRKKSIVKYRMEFFPKGNRKSVIQAGRRYDYDENWNFRRSWERKSISRSKKNGMIAATFYFEEYDIKGEVLKSGRLYSRLYGRDEWLHLTPEFPVDMDSVPIQDFKEVVYHNLNIKDVYKWDFANNKTTIERYEKQGDIWVEKEKRSFPRITN